MSSLDYTTVAGWINDIAPQMVDDGVIENMDFYRSIPEEPVENGKGKQWKHRYSGNASAGPIVSGQPFPAGDPSEYADASLPFVYYGGTVELDKKALIAAQVNANDNQIPNMVYDEVRQGMKGLGKLVNDKCLTGDGTSGELAGVAQMIGRTNTYAGIDRSTYSTFRPTIIHNSGTPTALTEDMFAELWRTARDAGANYDVILTSGTQRDKAKALSTVSVRQSMEAVGGRKGMTLGVTDVFYEEAPILQVYGWPSGRIDALRTGAVRKQVLVNFQVNKIEEKDFVVRFELVWAGLIYLPEPQSSAGSIQDLS